MKTVYLYLNIVACLKTVCLEWICEITEYKNVYNIALANEWIYMNECAN